MLIVAGLSALVGALLTWLVLYLSRGRRGEPADEPRAREDSGEKDLLRVARTEDGLAIFVRDKRRRHLQEIKDRETNRETVAAVKAVLAFAEGWLPSVREGKGWHEDARPSGQPSGGIAGRPPRQPPGRTADTGQPAAPSSSEPPTLFEQIDVLIQRRLQERPALARRGIRLTQDIEGRLLIYVGEERYRSAADIPDEEVSAFIRETVEMWENQ